MTLDLVRLRELEAAATPGPLRVECCDDGWYLLTESDDAIAQTPLDKNGECDAELIVALRNAAGVLLDAAERYSDYVTVAEATVKAIEGARDVALARCTQLEAALHHVAFNMTDDLDDIDDARVRARALLADKTP